MAYKYEIPPKERMREILRCAYQDRESLISSHNGCDLSEEDKEEIKECKSLCRDIIRMDANLGFGLFHESHVKKL